MCHVSGVIDQMSCKATITHSEYPAFWGLYGFVARLVKRNDKSWRNYLDIDLIISKVSFQGRGIAVNLFRQLLEVYFFDCSINCWILYVFRFKEVGYKDDCLSTEDDFNWSQPKCYLNISFVNLFFRQVTFNMVNISLTNFKF